MGPMTTDQDAAAGKTSVPEGGTAIPIEVHDLTVSYDKKPVLWNIDVAFPEGQIAGIIGPNGAGKSTLIKALLGFLVPDAGRMHVLGLDVAESPIEIDRKSVV